eukprot:TRINITY_DN2275_c0_g1_i7.p1 TRINITY_DN2275_c0_g1~~TRINITY_DN2275_c0_g1_i7.p1  ORF type:complete len:184 (+),score=8.45 TRINITY_DN2275_c0_g1_i7:69-620(+)
MSIMEYNGSGIIAMTGKNCVAIASDTRFGIQQTTIGMNFQRIFKMHDRLFIGLAGLATDVQTMSQKLRFRLNLYHLKEERQIKPKTFANLVSNMLYERRFGPYFTEPVVAGLEEDGTPFITAMDLIGAPVVTNDFVVAGTCSEQLYGTCEAFYRPNMVGICFALFRFVSLCFALLRCFVSYGV